MTKYNGKEVDAALERSHARMMGADYYARMYRPNWAANAAVMLVIVLALILIFR